MYDEFLTVLPLYFLVFYAIFIFLRTKQNNLFFCWTKGRIMVRNREVNKKKDEDMLWFWISWHLIKNSGHVFLYRDVFLKCLNEWNIKFRYCKSDYLDLLLIVTKQSYISLKQAYWVVNGTSFAFSLPVAQIGCVTNRWLTWP